MNARMRRTAVLLAALAALMAVGPASSGVARGDSALGMRPAALEAPWGWPLTPDPVLARPFVAPPSAYGPGHRGIDLIALGDAAVRAPASGFIAFAGQVAGREIVTIDHGHGLVSTLEPVRGSKDVGAPVRRGEVVGALSIGGHAAPGMLHFGVRRDGEYINPLALLGGVPRAVLLPCCG